MCKRVCLHAYYKRELSFFSISRNYFALFVVRFSFRVSVFAYMLIISARFHFFRFPRNFSKLFKKGFFVTQRTLLAFSAGQPFGFVLFARAFLYMLFKNRRVSNFRSFGLVRLGPHRDESIFRSGSVGVGFDSIRVLVKVRYRVQSTSETIVVYLKYH